MTRIETAISVRHFSNTWKALEHEPPKDEIENPHGTVSRTYANEVAAKDPENLPFGSILVREDYDDKRKRQSISVLYRVKDYDKEHGNWYSLRFTETGTVMKGQDNKALAGKVAACIECHTKAGGKDSVFSNDALKTEKPPMADTPTKECPRLLNEVTVIKAGSKILWTIARHGLKRTTR